MSNLAEIISALWGLILGSFANVYFYRIPKNLSLITPGSFCPQCRQPILYWDNIPVLSFFLLGGRCRYCHSRIPRQYVATELLCAILFVLVAIKFDEVHPVILAFLLAFSFLVFLSGGIDLVTYFQFEKQYGIIPNHLVGILAGVGLLFAPFNPVFDGTWYLSLAGGTCGIILLLLLRWLSGKVSKKESLGLGDVKLVGAIGIFMGWKGMIATLALGSLLGTVVILPLILTKKLDRYSSLPFGPFLAMGSLIALFNL